jgi:hypothetical protein
MEEIRYIMVINLWVCMRFPSDNGLNTIDPHVAVYGGVCET